MFDWASLTQKPSQRYRMSQELEMKNAMQSSGWCVDRRTVRGGMASQVDDARCHAEHTYKNKIKIKFKTLLPVLKISA